MAHVRRGRGAVGAAVCEVSLRNNGVGPFLCSLDSLKKKGGEGKGWWRGGGDGAARSPVVVEVRS